MGVVFFLLTMWVVHDIPYMVMVMIYRNLHDSTKKMVSMETVPNKLVASHRYSAVSTFRTGLNSRVPFWYCDIVDDCMLWNVF